MDFSKYRLIKTSSNGKIKFFKYSDISRIEEKEHFVYHYPYDNLSVSEIKEARVVLFAGKTGDGKSTAINVFFNIIKGIKLEYTYRFILIDETSNNRGQDQSQTDGVHLYYLRDYDNRPLIIIDSQGFGDTRGFEYDLRLNKSFEYIFSNKLNHLSAVCFIVKASDRRLDDLSKYIINRVTGLFAEDLSKNFFLLTTHATSQTMEIGPCILDSFKNDEFFSGIIKKMRKKFCFSFDSIEILYKNKVYEDSINAYSFKQLKDFYHQAVIHSLPINIKNTATVLVNQNNKSTKSNQLKNIFQDLSLKQKNLISKRELISKKIDEIEILNQKIENTNLTIKNTSPEEQNKILQDLLSMIDLKIKDLNKETTDEIYANLQQTSEKDTYYTYCEVCKKNCHDPCDCWFTDLTRCKVFTVPWSLGLLGENVCEKCGCVKSKHKVASPNHFVSATRKVSVDNSRKIDDLIDKKNSATQITQNNIEEKNNLYNTAKDNLKTLESRKKQLEEEKLNFENNKADIEKEMKETKKEILKTVLELQKISNTLGNLAMNKNPIKAENEYIDELSAKLSLIGVDKNEQIQKLNEIKNLNNQFMKYAKIDIKDLENMNIDNLVDDFFNNNA